MCAVVTARRARRHAAVVARHFAARAASATRTAGARAAAATRTTRSRTERVGVRALAPTAADAVGAIVCSVVAARRAGRHAAVVARHLTARASATAGPAGPAAAAAAARTARARTLRIRSCALSAAAADAVGAIVCSVVAARRAGRHAAVVAERIARIAIRLSGRSRAQHEPRNHDQAERNQAHRNPFLAPRRRSQCAGLDVRNNVTASLLAEDAAIP